MELELSLATAIALFLGASAVVVFSAVMLARAGDVIAARTGLGHLWVGSLLIAGATSLPELVTNVTAVRIDNPGLAAGNILGANMLNVSNLAVIAAIFGGREIYRRLSKGQEYLAIVAFAMTALAATHVVLGSDAHWFGVSPAAISILVIYLVGSRVLYVASKNDPAGVGGELPERSLSWGWAVFLVSAAFVAVSAWALALSADAIADETGISASFIGVLAVAIVTTLPELTVGVTSIRIGAPEDGGRRALRQQRLQHRHPGRGGPGLRGRCPLQLAGLQPPHSGRVCRAAHGVGTHPGAAAGGRSSTLLSRSPAP